jgi:hypothetical protein
MRPHTCKLIVPKARKVQSTRCLVVDFGVRLKFLGRWQLIELNFFAQKGVRPIAAGEQ